MQNTFWYNQIGNVGFVGYSAIYPFSEQKSDFEESICKIQQNINSVENTNICEQEKIIEINIENKNEANSFSDLFGSKNVPKDIRKIVDEETLGISLSERRGIDILFGDIPETGVVIDAKKEALRIRKNKSSGQKLNSTPSPALDINSGKSLLIK